ncbi:hypothetical protein UlMin_005660 [Ulmus minor]
MGKNDKKQSGASWCFLASSSSFSTCLLLVVVPLIVISGFVSVLGPKNSNWVFTSSYSSNVSSLKIIGPVSNSKLVVDLDLKNGLEEAVSDDSVLNRSSSPPLDVEAISPSQEFVNETKEKSFNLSTSEPFIVDPLVNSSSQVEPFTKAKLPQRGFTKLEWLEGHLMRARTAIREAKIGNHTLDPDYVPIGPMYHNAKVFHRSYFEMEKKFKIFVYKEGEHPLFHNGPCKSIYSMEGNFIHELEMNNQFRTNDPEKAHVFFLPFSVTMLVRYVYLRESRDFGPIRQTVIDYINLLSERYSFWNRSLGADHFMLSCHDWGPETSNSHPYLRKNSIRVLCNANTSEGFNPSKDVSFPEINLLSGAMDGLLGGPSASHRPVLAFFAGGLHGPIRPILLEHWENKDQDMKIQKYLPKGVSYYDMLRSSKFCICPSGYEVASPRIVEAIYTGCVPVLISDHYVPPFSDVLNWKSFSVEVSVKDIPNMKRILMQISPRQYIRMQRRVVQVRRHFEVNSPPKRFDVFHMILHSVWLRRLNIRVQNDE